MAMTGKNHRFDDEAYSRFVDRCNEIGRDPSEMIRELVDAFTESRIKITADDKTEKSLEMYK